MKTLVSIIIPTYNRKKVISNAIDSCLNQTYEPIEIVVCDDHSTDGTMEYLQGKYAGIDNIIYCATPVGRKGASAARNEAIKKSRGEVLVFLDSDDCLVENSVETRLVSMKENRCGFVYGNVYIKTGAKLRLHEHDTVSAMEQKQYLMQELSLCCMVSIMVKRSVALEIGCFDENLPAWEDDDFVIKVGMKHRLCHCGKVCTIINTSKNGLSLSYLYRYIGCRELIKKNKQDIIRYTSFGRYLIWKVRLISLWMKAKAQKESNMNKRIIFELFGGLLDRMIRKCFRHIYA